MTTLKQLIWEEMKKLMKDDALFKNFDNPGLEKHLDIPGDHGIISRDSHREDDLGGRNLSYGHSKSTDDEGRMTKKQLYYISRKAQSLHDMLDDEDDLPEWVQSKISRSADKIQSVYDYLEYKIKTRDY
jgi:hypothetical protein